MFEPTTNSIPAQPVYIIQPQQPQNSEIFGGLGGFALSVLAGLLLGQVGGGIGIPRIPKL